jgi:hypothetical protein
MGSTLTVFRPPATCSWYRSTVGCCAAALPLRPTAFCDGQPDENAAGSPNQTCASNVHCVGTSEESRVSDEGRDAFTAWGSFASPVCPPRLRGCSPDHRHAVGPDVMSGDPDCASPRRTSLEPVRRGLAISCRQQDSAEALISRCDRNLYGRNKGNCFPQCPHEIPRSWNRPLLR